MGLDKDQRRSAAAPEPGDNAEGLLGEGRVKCHPPRDRVELQRLTNILEIHQIEQDMQNIELLRTRDELELSRNKYSELYDFAPIGYFTFDTLGLIREVNLTGAHLLGIARLMLINKPFRGFIPDAWGKAILSHHFESVMQGSGIQRCELILKGKDGTVIHGLLQSVMVDSMGSKDRVICPLKSDQVEGCLRERNSSIPLFEVSNSYE